MKIIDLFAGAGGFSEAATNAGCSVVWAANHWQSAVDCHSMNHPSTLHVCQDLHQANWAEVPRHDVMLASPACQGHSRARGVDKPHHDATRSTAWAVVSCLEYHKTPVGVVENVPEFLQWNLYLAWKMALEALGYKLSVNLLDSADFGVPQNRVRVFIVLTRTKTPFEMPSVEMPHRPARSFLDANASWSLIDRPGRSKATLERIKRGRGEFGDSFLFSYYGNTKSGRSLDRPIGTITTRDRWALVNGDHMRMLTMRENRKAMGFREDYWLPDNHKTAMHLMGNAVCPPVPEAILHMI